MQCTMQIHIQCAELGNIEQESAPTFDGFNSYIVDLFLDKSPGHAGVVAGGQVETHFDSSTHAALVLNLKAQFDFVAYHDVSRQVEEKLHILFEKKPRHHLLC